MNIQSDEPLPGGQTQPKGILALFDFDGTLTVSDTLPEIIRFVHGSHHYRIGLAFLFSHLLLYKLKMISNQKAKERVLSYFFKGTREDEFRKQCGQFATEILPRLLHTEAMNALLRLKAEGARIIIVSASAEDWILPWSTEIGAECVATRLEIKDGRLTGRIDGLNCHGKEKVNRIRSAVDLSKYDRIYAFGDSEGDRQMLDLATHPFYRTFNL